MCLAGEYIIIIIITHGRERPATRGGSLVFGHHRAHVGKITV